jgi:hypothetical protein
MPSDIFKYHKDEQQRALIYLANEEYTGKAQIEFEESAAKNYGNHATTIIYFVGLRTDKGIRGAKQIDETK